MPSGIINTIAQIAGLAISGLLTRTADGQLAHEITLPAGSAGTLDTRTDHEIGMATVASGHGLATADIVDIYWATGMRYGAAVSVVGDEITFDFGAGDALPATTTAVVVTKQVEINSDIDGDDVQLIVAKCDQRANMDFQDSGNASLAAVELVADEQWYWAADSGITNPLTGNAVDAIHASNGSSTSVATLQVGVLYDSTP